MFAPPPVLETTVFATIPSRFHVRDRRSRWVDGRVPLLPSGGVTKVGVFVQLSGGLGGPDGLALDERGNLAIAHFGLGTVWLVSPLGEPLYRIRSSAGLATTNVAYGGEDRRTLYITESETGSILTARLDVPGRLMYSHM